MGRPNRETKRRRAHEFGLAAFYVIGRELLGLEDLHYGYWQPNVELSWQNLSLAQASYTEHLLAAIPPGVHSILDVGIGAGAQAAKLLDRGYEVTGVSPRSFLTRFAEERLAHRGKLLDLPFEEFPEEETFDLILFSESFQYVKMEDSLAKAARILKPGGHLLICDFFDRSEAGDSPMNGGHDLTEFRTAIATQPFEMVSEQDITAETAPTLDLVNTFYLNGLKPIYEMGLEHFEARRPTLSRIVRWRFRSKLARFQEKRLSGTRTGARFAQHKSYLRLLFTRT